ncbi:ATP-binding protein [bacterium]|nr:ATP-binding protein [bacterium]
MKGKTEMRYRDFRESKREIVRLASCTKAKYFEKTACCVINNKRIENVVTLISLIDKDQEVKKRKNLIYPNFAFLHEVCKIEELDEFLDLISSKALKVCDRNIYFTGRVVNLVERKYLHSVNQYSFEPGNLFTIEGDMQLDIPQSLLLSKDMPFYPSISEAIYGWTGLKSFKESNDSRQKKIFIFLPQKTVHFEAIRYMPKQDMIVFYLNEEVSKGKIFVKGAIRIGDELVHIDGNIQRTFKIQITKDQVKEFEEIELFLIDEYSNILDYHIEKERWFQGVKRIFNEYEKGKSENVVRNAILLGENEKIEFKENYKKTDNNWENEIVDTVSAFANHKGGTIYIGIKDNLEIKGVVYGKIRTHDELQNYVRKILSDNLNKELEVAFKVHNFKGKKILAIQIPEGISKPYYNIFTRVPYIRRGANNMKADPDTDLKEMFETKDIPEIFRKLKRRKK